MEVAKLLGIEIKRNKTMCFKGHDSKTPSLTFTPQKNLFYCFGCGIGGSNIDLVMQASNMDYRSSIAWLKEKFSTGYLVKAPTFYNTAFAINKSPSKNTALPDPELYTALINKLQLSDRGMTYLHDRGFSNETLLKFKIKDLTDPKNTFTELIKVYGMERLRNAGLTRLAKRMQGEVEDFIWWDYAILFPFYEGNKISYIQGRRLNPVGPKYLGLKGISKPLYNLSIIENFKKNDLLLICEGIPDVLAAYEMGYEAIGVLGAHSFNNQWVKALLPFDLVIIPDNDAAGTGFAKKVQKLFLSQGKIIQIVRMENVKDLSELHQQKCKDENELDR